MRTGMFSQLSVGIWHLAVSGMRSCSVSYMTSVSCVITAPQENIATTKASACVVEGVSRSRNALINGDTNNYDWDSGYTCHQLGSGAVLVQLAQPYMLSSMRWVVGLGLHVSPAGQRGRPGAASSALHAQLNEVSGRTLGARGVSSDIVLFLPVHVLLLRCACCH